MSTHSHLLNPILSCDSLFNDFSSTCPTQGQRVLYAGELRVRRDSRLELREGTTNLRISRVEPGDAGEYECEVCGWRKQKYHMYFHIT